MRILFVLMLFFPHLFAFDVDFKNLHADFIQTVSSKQGKITYRGNFILQDGKAFWSYEEPSKKEIYINDDEIVIIEHDLEQVIVSKLKKLPNLNEIFKKAKKRTPSKFEARYENINYIIELEEDEIKKISYEDALENFVSIMLFNVRRNQAIDATIFTPKYPAHYDIVR